MWFLRIPKSLRWLPCTRLRAIRRFYRFLRRPSWTCRVEGRLLEGRPMVRLPAKNLCNFKMSTVKNAFSVACYSSYCCWGILTIFILTAFNFSFADSCASFFVWNVSLSSIHGKLSSIFIHVVYAWLPSFDIRRHLRESLKRLWNSTTYS